MAVGGGGRSLAVWLCCSLGTSASQHPGGSSCGPASLKRAPFGASQASLSRRCAVAGDFGLFSGAMQGWEMCGCQGQLGGCCCVSETGFPSFLWLPSFCLFVPGWAAGSASSGWAAGRQRLNAPALVCSFPALAYSASKQSQRASQVQSNASVSSLFCSVPAVVASSTLVWVLSHCFSAAVLSQRQCLCFPSAAGAQPAPVSVLPSAAGAQPAWPVFLSAASAQPVGGQRNSSLAAALLLAAARLVCVPASLHRCRVPLPSPPPSHPRPPVPPPPSGRAAECAATGKRQPAAAAGVVTCRGPGRVHQLTCWQCCVAADVWWWRGSPRCVPLTVPARLLQSLLCPTK